MTLPIGVVVIGRNEGERLRRCLRSIVGQARSVVYVDSGSTDDSVAFSQGLGVATVEIDPAVPFTAARARNMGFFRMRELDASLELVQFVDGDCEVVADWWARAYQELESDPRLAVVCGRRRERYPDASVYNRLCDLEWDTPIGDAKSCGGDALMRVAPVQAAGGYNPDLIAGEEPDLCLRMRQAGWKVRRIDAEMTLHDAAMKRFGQWWKRTLRAGYAFAEGAARHGHEPERHWVKESKSIWFWGVAVPVAALGLAPLTFGVSLVLLGGYPVLAVRIYRSARRRGIPAPDARLQALFGVVGKFPEALGHLRYWARRVRGTPGKIIEYKQAEPPAAS